jgi:predicted nucleic acid-binding protein
MASVIILDANVIIAFLDQSDAHHEEATDLVERRFHDGFGASVLTVAEALVYPARASRGAAAFASLTAIGVRILPLEATDALALARVRNSFKVRMPDAVALHAALSTDSELATFDQLLIVAAERAGVSIAR